MGTAAEPRQLASGTMLDDKYRIDALIAVGGMGAVYAGTHVKLRKRVAIKVVNPQLATPAMIERFHREAITASQIGHEGIAQVTDLGTTATDQPFLVMELLDGEPLSARLKTRGPLPVEVACELACGILSPLAAAHQAGIVHRDLKPDNVYLVRQSRGEMIKLLDFGISRAQHLDSEFRLTTTGLVLGTPFYMSPEQARGQSDIGPAADLYALGVILYEMLIGQVPIHGENYNQLMYRVSVGEYTPPRQLRPDIPIDLEKIIVSAMSLQPSGRPGSATQLEAFLLPFCRPTYRDHTVESLAGYTGRSAFGPARTAPNLETDPTMAAPSTGAGPRPGLLSTAGPARRRGWLLALAAAVVLGGAAAISIVIQARGHAAPTVAPASTAELPTTAPAPPPPVEPAAAPPAAEAATIALRFAVEPSDAVVTVDGQPVTGGELVAPRDGTTHTVEVMAPGFVTYRDQATFTETQRLVIKLTREPTRPAPARPNRRPHRSPDRPKRIETESPYQ